MTDYEYRTIMGLIAICFVLLFVGNGINRIEDQRRFEEIIEKLDKIEKEVCEVEES
jgi:hypothetical protein